MVFLKCCGIIGVVFLAASLLYDLPRMVLVALILLPIGVGNILFSLAMAWVYQK